MVVLMLAALAFQAATGLFSDDEIATQGPLAAKVSDAVVSRMSGLHAVNEWVLVALAAAARRGDRRLPAIAGACGSWVP